MIRDLVCVWPVRCLQRLVPKSPFNPFYYSMNYRVPLLRKYTVPLTVCVYIFRHKELMMTVERFPWLDHDYVRKQRVAKRRHFSLIWGIIRVLREYYTEIMTFKYNNFLFVFDVYFINGYCVQKAKWTVGIMWMYLG